MNAKLYRIQALARLEAIKNYLHTLGDEYTESDSQVDDFLRIWGKLPKRPSDRKPYEGLFPSPKEDSNRTILQVPYYSQRDNIKDPHRTCFSSACAMLLKYLRPNAITGDDEYINKVFQVGDTTRADVQVQVLQMFNLKAKFKPDADYSDINRLLTNNIPVPIGFLHYGTDDNPSGGGHWAVVIGETPEDWIIHDPWGDLYTDYTNHDGRFVKYRKESFRKRFMPLGEKSGWIIEAINTNSETPNNATQNTTKTIAQKNLEAFLMVIRKCEGTLGEKGYRTIFSYKYFDSFADHPRKICTSNGLSSDAAGAYQFLSTTWDDVAQKLGLKDFSPENQDKAAIELIRRRGVLKDIEAGRITTACEALSYEWASLPPSRYGQPIHTIDQVRRYFVEYGGTPVKE